VRWERIDAASAVLIAERYLQGGAL
jgi:hypothetical protein